jgi:hypothetical protein
MVSLVIGAFAYLITGVLVDKIGDRWVSGLTLSVFIGGVTLVSQFLVDFEHRLAKVEAARGRYAQEIEKMVAAGFVKVDDSTELFRLLEGSAIAPDTVLQLVRHSTQLGPQAPSLVLRFAQSELSRMSYFLKELSEGDSVIYHGEDRDWMLALTRNAVSTIDATSLPTVDAGGTSFIDGGLWTSDLGQHYLEVQRERIQQGVRIRRVFILDRPGLASDPGLIEVCSHQCALGINVRLLDLSTTKGVHRQRLFDFVLFDDVVSYEVTPGALTVADGIRPTIAHTRLELGAAQVQDRIRRFKTLWELAQEFAPPVIR